MVNIELKKELKKVTFMHEQINLGTEFAEFSDRKCFCNKRVFLYVSKLESIRI